MPFPVANFTNPADIVGYASIVTGGLFWNLMLVAVWIVGFGLLMRYSTTERAFAAVSFFTGILSIMIWVSGGIDTVASIVWVALAIVGFIMLLFSKD